MRLGGRSHHFDNRVARGFRAALRIDGTDHFTNPRLDFRAIAGAVEHAVVANARLQIVIVLVGRNVGAQVVGRFGLADATDVVAFAFDCHDGGAADGRTIDQFAAMHHPLVGQFVLLEHGPDRLEVELGRQIHHSEIFVVELAVLVDAVAVALDEIFKQLAVGGLMTLKVHGHEARKLHEAGIDAAHEADLRERDDRDDVALKPAERFGHREFVHGGWVAARIDRSAHQSERGRLDRHIAFGHQCCRSKGWDRRLANRHDVSVGAEELHHVDNVVDEVVEVEAAIGDGNLPRIFPVGDVKLVVGDHRLDGAAQQRRVVARHGSNQQNFGIVAFASRRIVTGKVNEVGERFGVGQPFGDANA